MIFILFVTETILCFTYINTNGYIVSDPCSRTSISEKARMVKMGWNYNISNFTGILRSSVLRVFCNY